MTDTKTPDSEPQPEKTAQVDTPTGGGDTAKPQKSPDAKEGLFGRIWAGFGKFLQVVFTPIVWLLRPLVFRVKKEAGTPKVYFTSFSTLMYLWPIMVVGWVGCWLHGWEWISPPVMGWIWITIVLIVLLCIGSDTDRNKTIVIFLVVALLWVCGLLLEEKKGIPILSNIYDFLAARNVQFDPGTASVLSLATFVILLLVIFLAWFDGRYEITTREITHKRLLRTSDSLPRAAKRIKRDWRDLTEVFLGLGAGDLIVLDTNKNIVMRIPNIPFLWFFRHDVDHILEVLATTDVDEAAALEEEEDSA
ncbi:MAG: hypothetical protein ACE5EQ_00640 [Phycisphaerae bacterium]